MFSFYEPFFLCINYLIAENEGVMYDLKHGFFTSKKVEVSKRVVGLILGF